MTAVILSGGKSRRFGRDKAFFEINNKPMIAYVADILAPIFDNIIVAGGNIKQIQSLGLECYPDPIPEKGALGGIYNGLMQVENGSIFFCGCDMPLMKKDVIQVILENYKNDEALIPVVDNIIQPLHAVYSKSILPIVERLMYQDNQYLPNLWSAIKVNKLNETMFSHIDKYHHSFISFNDHETFTKYKSYFTDF